MSRPDNIASASARASDTSARVPAPSPTRLIARIWRGRTLEVTADDYTKYLYAEGVRKIAAVPGNCGVEMLRSVREGVADFQVISYWESLDAVKRFAGDDYEKPRPLPDDVSYMIGGEPTVGHFEVVAYDGPRRPSTAQST